MINRFLLPLILLGACTHIPQSEVATVSSIPSLSEEVQRAIYAGECESGDFPSATWWEVFHDETLTALIEQGMRDNLSLKAVGERLQGAEQEAKKVRAALIPHLGASYLEDWEHLSKYGFDRDFFPVPNSNLIPHQYNLIDLMLNFSYEFDFFGKNQNLFKAALGKARAMRAEFAQSSLLLSIQIAHTYFDCLALLEQNRLLDKLLESQKEMEELSSLRQVKGINSIIPVLNTQNLYQEFLHLKLLFEGEIAVRKHFLSHLLAIGMEDLPELKTKTLPSPQLFPIPTTLSTDLLARRPDLEAQICRVEAAAKEVGAAKADFYPNINLLAFGGVESLSFKTLFNGASLMGGLKPALHLPLFKGGEIRANFKGKIAEFNQAVYSYNNLILQAVEEVSNGLSLLQTHHKDLIAHEKQVVIQEQLLKLSSLRLVKGIGNALELLDAQETLVKEHVDFVTAQKTYLFTVLDLIRSLGGGYLSPVIHEEPKL